VLFASAQRTSSSLLILHDGQVLYFWHVDINIITVGPDAGRRTLRYEHFLGVFVWKHQVAQDRWSLCQKSKLV
jgi:hypothetical protein